ncbi:hypothetical protein SAMN06297251_10453 [Fulvimarina manganoxydans]|uniref:Uncharacterized protein n=1 Tax=Fulvimarina manganoxydans TaxID=937218 RepID=A0A1W2AAK4_9HYPH|nr:hypothetical protein [Fulvimarina manganoxydans]SMC57471.1 hypothetical protein SAMN06297251_10453 [Fulvimarina manganoxydans]
MLRAARTIDGIYPAFPLGGAVEVLEVGSTWQEIAVGSTDLAMIRVPADTKLVHVIATTDDLAGSNATAPQMDASWPLDPGVWTFCTDRDPDMRFYLAVDPTDARPGISATARVHVVLGATG